MLLVTKKINMKYKTRYKKVSLRLFYFNNYKFVFCVFFLSCLINHLKKPQIYIVIPWRDPNH